MELFSLLAKLTLDSKEYNKAIEEAKREANGLEIEDPSLGLDDSDFRAKISDAENADVDDPDTPSLDLDTDEYDQKIQDAEEKGESFGSIMSEVFQNIKGALATTGIVAAVGAIVSSLKEGVELAKNHGDQIDKQSQKMGISAKAYQEWAYALNLSGASIDDLNRGLRTWQQAVGDEEAVAKLSEAFGALGINAEEAFKKIEKGENLDELLNQTLYALADRSEGDRGWIAEALFGRGANELNALFANSSKELKDMKQEAEDLGAVMSDEEVKNAAAYMDATTRLQASLEGLKEAFAGSILPLLTDAANTLARIVALFNPRDGENSLAETFEEIDTKTVTSSTKIEQLSAKAQSLIEKLSSLGDYWTLDEKGQKTWDALAQELIDIYPEFETVINKENKKINENTDVIKENIRQWALREKQQVLENSLAEKKALLAEQYAKALDKEIQAEVKESDADGERVTAIEQMNDILKKNEELRDAVQGRFGTSTVTNENAAEMFNYAKEFMPTLPMGMEAVDKWFDLQQQANSLRKEAQELSDEADEAAANLETYQTKLAEKLGITATEAEDATTEVQNLKKELDALPREVTIDINTPHKAYAIGSAYIPYDQLAYLHRGEKVLTTAQARNDGSVSTGAVIEQLQGLRNDLTNLKLVVGKKTFGRAVVDYGGDRMNDYIGSSDSGRSAGYGT